MENRTINVSGYETITRKANVEVDVIDFLNNLKCNICGVPAGAYIDKKDKKVKTSKDISTHGSPLYVYEEYELSENKYNILECIEALEKYIKTEVL